MKKQYDAPNAKKVEFDYTETVVASGQTNQPATRCWGTPSCSQTPVIPVTPTKNCWSKSDKGCTKKF